MTIAPLTVVDVTEADFATKVIERSHSVPVVVDFWAPWCGPCRVLGPILERLAAQANGAWVLAKLNVDNAPTLSAQYGIQGIPAVKAFKNGRVAGQFVGAQPESAVRNFLALLAPSETEQLVEAGATLERQGDLAGAAAKYRSALAHATDDPQALLGLGRTLVALGQEEEGLATLQRVADHLDYGPEARALLAKARFAQVAREVGGVDAAQAKASAEPANLDAQYALASALAAQGDYAQALDAFLSIVRRNRAWHNGAARQAMLDLFDMLGDENPVTREYRGKLAQALF